MKKITKSMLTLALLLAGTVSASAQEDEVLDFDGTFYHNWDEVSNTATDNGEAGGGVKIGEEVNLGGTIWGNLSGAVPYLCYANITDYSELRFEGTPGAVIRLMCNRVVDEGPIFELKPTIGDDGKLTVKISDLKFLNGGAACDFVCLQSIKVPANWQGGTIAATITSIKIVKPGDPLSVPKEALKAAINAGKSKSAVGKTAESFSDLTSAISAGETVLASESATKESLEDAAKAILDAIDGLKLADGYISLTSAMFKAWDSATAPTTAANTGCAYELNTSSGMPYGNGSVALLTFADLSAFDKLIVVAPVGTPRILLNRDVDEGQWNEDEAESHLIDNTKDGWSNKYFTTEGTITTVDLKQLATDKNFAHVHSIKGGGGNVTVTEMLLYRSVKVAEKYATFGTILYDGEQKGSHFEGITVYEAKYDEGKIKLTELTSGDVPAGKGVILMGEADDYQPTLDVEVSDMDSELLVSNGTVAGDGKTIYVLTKKDGKFGFAKMKEGVKVPAGKCYLVIPAESREFIGFETETTGIETVGVAEAQKAVFNLAGQRLMKAQKGVNVINGKKVVMK